MKYSLLLLVVVLACSELTCQDGKLYAKITKKTAGSASQESFQILSGTTVLYTSPSLVNNEERELEVCLDPTTTGMYSLLMKDTSSYWTNGAWIQIEGINGNLVFKGMMVASKTETYQFSLYSPVNKGSTWKYTANASGNWKDVNYSDVSWVDVTTGSTTQSATGNQYFRNVISISPDFAALELQLNYRFGVVAYINGIEIYRDNMPEGEVQPSTLPAGVYPNYSYRGVIRSADAVVTSACVLAVEVHPSMPTYQEVIEFNGFLSMLAGIAADNQCFVLPYDPIVTNTGFNTPTNAFTWTYSSRAYSNAEEPTLTADFSALVAAPLINGLRIWPYTSPTTGLSSFAVHTSDTASGTYTSFFESDGNTYTSKVWKQFSRLPPAAPSKFYRLTAYNAVSSTTKAIYELQYMVCKVSPPASITFTLEKTSYYKNFEAVDIKPDMYGLNNCQISPNPPNGLTWNSQECSLTGISTELLSQQTYTVTTMIGATQISGSFTISYVDCAGSMYKIVRTYKSDPQNEYFRFYDSSNMNVVYEIQQGHSSPASTNWEHYLCMTVERFDVTFYSTSNYWASGSYFNLYYMLPNDEQELVVKGRYDMNENTEINIYARRPSIGHSQQWYYKFDSVPTTWHSSDVSGWQQASRGNFGTATNKVQLFKQTFNVNNLNEIKGAILSIRYKYGCVVYLNGHEAWRNGVTGEVGTAAVVDNAYTDLKYRVVTLPAKSIITATQPTAINYIQQGTNTIAIALIATADTQTTVDFDCVVRLMPSEQSESHIWEFTGSESGMTGSYSNPFTRYYSNTIYYGSSNPCSSNNLIIVLDNDRREWVSSVEIQNYYTYTDSQDPPAQFEFYARNGDAAEWTLLKNATGLTWSLLGQRRKIYFQNNMSYNQFKFANIFPANHATQCKWRVQSLNMIADNPLAELDPLVYPTTVEIFKDIEMSEVIPTGDGYGDFSIAPALPGGVALDPATGWISGTATDIAAATTYTITANKFTGGTVTVTISLSVAVCTGTRSLMTVRFRADAYEKENSWKLYQGRGTTGTVLQQVDTFPVKSTYYYIDFCLNHAIYTFEGIDLDGDGWSTNTGYTLTVDIGDMELEIQELASGTAPVTTTTVFSTYFPFQAGYTDWKVNQSGFVEGWTGVAFDDSAWTTMKAAEIPATEYLTTYIRKTFTITNIADYQVLNIRLVYTGGVAAYFNGNLVGLVNMVEDFDDTTESIEVHDATVSSKFHVILPTAGMVEGTNVMAFEVHRPKGTTSTEPVVFDATGVFGVEDCSVVVDSYSLVESTEPSAGTVAGIMDLDPYTTGNFPNSIGTFMEWTVENLLGSKWNALNIYVASTRSSWGFNVYATFDPSNPENEPITAFEGTSLRVVARTRPNIAIPVALAGFRKYRWEVTDTSSGTGVFSAFFMTYCKATGEVCPAIENYPSVSEGQISPSACPAGYKGYSYRECVGGVLGEVKLDQCFLRAPANARYGKKEYKFVVGTQVTTGVPAVLNTVARWYVDETVSLPDGLYLNEQTGEISGKPTSEMEVTSFTIYAENASGAVSTAVTMSIRKGQCAAEGVFPLTNVGEEAIYECSQQGAYIGTQKRLCKLGVEDGEWEKASGACISIFAIVIGILLALVILVIVIFVIMRTTRKAKAVGGVKGKSKKSTKSNKLPKTESKKADKAVKI